MPELPEVETVVRTLESLVKDKKIKNVEVYYEKVLKNIDVNFFEQKLINQSFKEFKRIGKYLIFNLDDYSLVSHLRMEGKYNFSEEYVDKSKHDIFKITFTDDSQLVYNDVRKFGTMEVTKINEYMQLEGLSKLGPEPFDESFTVAYIKGKSKNKKSPIKSFLLDQTVVTGLGNIYVDEVLFCSNIHPLTETGKVSKAKFEKIIDCSKKVLQKAINEGGTTVKSFSISGDITGMFQHELNVYGRKDESCHNCNTKIVKIKVGGRGTHYCPKCQKK